jgi:hypothetical protein
VTGLGGRREPLVPLGQIAKSLIGSNELAAEFCSDFVAHACCDACAKMAGLIEAQLDEILMTTHDLVDYVVALESGRPVP